ITFQELFEARRIVEPELAARAARRRSDEDVADLERTLEAMKEAVSRDAEALAEQDLRFHEIIWRASGNRVCQRMFSSLHRAMSRSLNVTSSLSEGGMPVLAHENMLRAIQAGDGEQARSLMTQHLLDGERTILKTTVQVETLVEV